MRWHDSCISAQLYDTETDSTGAGDSPGPHLGPALPQLPDSASDTGHYYTKKMRRKHGLGLKVGIAWPRFFIILTLGGFLLMIKSQEKVSRERHYIYLVLENIFKRSLTIIYLK